VSCPDDGDSEFAQWLIEAGPDRFCRTPKRACKTEKANQATHAPVPWIATWNVGVLGAADPKSNRGKSDQPLGVVPLQNRGRTGDTFPFDCTHQGSEPQIPPAFIADAKNSLSHLRSEDLRGRRQRCRSCPVGTELRGHAPLGCAITTRVSPILP